MIQLRVLLVHPCADKDFFGNSPCFLPLGLAYIAAVLEREIAEVRVLDLTANRMSLSEFREFTTTLKPDLVGFTAVTPTANAAYKLARAAKEGCGAMTVVGGPHVTALPEEALEHGVDYVVRGEGKETMLELLRALDPAPGSVGRDLRAIAGLSYRSESGIVHNPNRPFIRDLDELPLPARHLFPPLKTYVGQPALGNRFPVANIMTSRGCPFDCIFCYKACFGRLFRARSADSVIAEWRDLVHRYGVKEIAVSDDAFATSASRVADICDRLIAESLNIPWSCANGLRVDVASEKLLKKMREAGCYRVAFGVESGNEEILKTIGKKIDLGQVADAVRNAKRVGIHVTLFFMLGNPGETRETMEDTIRLAKRLKPDFAQFTLAAPFPGTKLYEIVRQQGRILVDDWGEYGSYEGRPYFELGELTADLLRETSQRAYREFYLRPGYVFKKLTTLNTYRFLRATLRGTTKFLFTKS